MNKNGIRNKIIMFFIILIIYPTIRNDTYGQKSSKQYPKPPKTEKHLFYIQRSMNTYTIVYDLNNDNYGKLNIDNPIIPYWIRYEEDGRKEDLSFIQRKYAYGVITELIDKKNLTYNLTIVSYPEQKILLKKLAGNSNIKAYTTVNGKFIELQKIFIKTVDGAYLSSSIKYIDISGIEVKSGNFVTCRTVPGN